MKTKNLILSLAIVGGLLFTVEATNIIDLNGQATTQVDKTKLKVPTWGSVDKTKLKVPTNGVDKTKLKVPTWGSVDKTKLKVPTWG